MFQRKRIYLDYASITPVDRRVLSYMRKKERIFGNPSSIHEEGRMAQSLLSEARTSIARMAQVKQDEVIFTSGGTESNNLVIHGIISAYAGSGVPHIITSVVEHPSVLEVIRNLERQKKITATYLPVNKDGLVIPDDIVKHLNERTLLVSIMLVNNELGVIQPVSDIASLVRAYRSKQGTKYPFIHTDASQAPCYLDMHLGRLGADVATFDSIKVYGPRGIGCIVLRNFVSMDSIMYGGGQEKGLRSGTENSVAVAGFAEALRLAEQERKSEVIRLTNLQEYCIGELHKNFAEASINGSLKNRLPNNVNVCFPDVDAEFLVIQLDEVGIATSFASSCLSRTEDTASYVIEALGKSECAISSLRISMGRKTTKRHIRRLISALKDVIEKSKRF